MGTGPPHGEQFRQCGSGRAEDQSHERRHHGERGRVVGRRPSAVGQRSGNTRNLVVGLDSLVAVQGNGWGWRHVQGIGQPTAGAHDIG